jgi:hypothetical protein
MDFRLKGHDYEIRDTPSESYMLTVKNTNGIKVYQAEAPTLRDCETIGRWISANWINKQPADPQEHKVYRVVNRDFSSIFSCVKVYFLTGRFAVSPYAALDNAYGLTAFDSISSVTSFMRGQCSSKYDVWEAIARGPMPLPKRIGILNESEFSMSQIPNMIKFIPEKEWPGGTVMYQEMMLKRIFTCIYY